MAVAAESVGTQRVDQVDDQVGRGAAAGWRGRRIAGRRRRWRPDCGLRDNQPAPLADGPRGHRGQGQPDRLGDGGGQGDLELAPVAGRGETPLVGAVAVEVDEEPAVAGHRAPARRAQHGAGGSPQVVVDLAAPGDEEQTALGVQPRLGVGPPQPQEVEPVPGDGDGAVLAGWHGLRAAQVVAQAHPVGAAPQELGGHLEVVAVRLGPQDQPSDRLAVDLDLYRPRRPGRALARAALEMQRHVARLDHREGELGSGLEPPAKRTTALRLDLPVGPAGQEVALVVDGADGDRAGLPGDPGECEVLAEIVGGRLRRRA